MLLWFVAFDGLAHDLAQICVLGPNPTPSPSPSPSPSPVPGEVAAPKTTGSTAVATILQLNDGYKNQLLALCAWPNSSSRNEATLSALWDATMSFDAPPTEFEAWRDYYLGEQFATADSPTALNAMLKAIFLNPYFLLRP